jgi:hypothetical protein
LCFDCQIDLAPKKMLAIGPNEQQWDRHMRECMGEPPGTVIVWYLPIFDRSARLDGLGGRIWYPGIEYLVCVDWWDDAWPQSTLPWGPDPRSPQLVTLGARVAPAPSFPIRMRDWPGEETWLLSWWLGQWAEQASWVFSWWWPEPERPEICRLDPPRAALKDDEIVRLNHARGAFYTFEERRGLKSGAKLAWPYDKATWQEAGRQAEATLVARHGRQPTDGELAVEMGMTKPTFDRRKRDWGPPTHRE